MEKTIKGITYQGALHPNGGGFVREGVEVSKDVYVGKRATILGGTIRGGTIWGGTIEGGTITKNVTFMTGCFPHNVTITDTHCGVGCQWHTIEHWLEYGKEIMDSEKSGWGGVYMPLLKRVLHLHLAS